MVDINWQFQAAIQGGPVLATNQPVIKVGGYDYIQVTVAAQTNNVAVPIQPAAAAGDVIFMAVVSDVYDPGVTYSVDAIGANHILDGPHLLIGSGAVSLLNNNAPPKLLTFNNTLTKPVDVQVIVGRKVP